MVNQTVAEEIYVMPELRYRYHAHVFGCSWIQVSTQVWY